MERGRERERDTEIQREREIQRDRETERQRDIVQRFHFTRDGTVGPTQV